MKKWPLGSISNKKTPRKQSFLQRAPRRRGGFERLERRELLAADPIYRINAGGPELVGSPAWAADTDSDPSPFSNFDPGEITSGGFGVASPIDLSHSTIPPGTPEAVFQTQRFDKPNQPNLEWDFPVTPGEYEVRLYFSEIFAGGFQVGFRRFDVEIEGALLLDDYDVFAAAGANAGIVESFVVSSDENLDINFWRTGANNPIVMGIEVLPAPVGSVTLGVSASSIDFGNVLVETTSQQQVTLAHEGASGDAAITIDPAAASIAPASAFDADFGSAGPIVLHPGDSTVVTVDYNPTAEQLDSATLSIPHDGLDSPIDITLSGQGVAQQVIDFDKSNLSGAEALSRPTSLQFGPDDRLYVSQQNGLIRVFDIVRNSSTDYTVVSEEVITLIQDIPNHDDDGTPNPVVDERLVTGLLVTGTPQSPVIYVTSSDPRIGGGNAGTDLNLDTNSSILSRLTWNGTTWDKLDLVRGLPRSEENHALNGMALDETTNTLYVTAGGNTNMGATSNNFAFLPEFAYSAVILSVDLDAIGEATYDLPTLDDEDQPGVDATDPFGGNSGKNQAVIVPGGPVRVYAPGFRNPYDVVLTSRGRLYSVDNGPNADWGDVPIGEGPEGNATNEVNEPGVTYGDGLHYIDAPGYYGGHPNPTRSNPANTFNETNPQSPISVPNPIESDYQIPGVENGSLIVFPNSTNGITEYTADDFGGQLQGDLIIASFDNTIKRVKLNDAGDQIVLAEDLFSNVGFLPLDVTTPASGPFLGSIWVADVALGTLTVFEPAAGGNNGTPNDLDGDGFSNDDENANGTNPNNSADFPADNDGDFISDLLDNDDDNDGLLDATDFFAIDPDNGATTPIGVEYDWENEGENLGGIFGLGFTGLMSNGVDNYEALFDPTAVTAGGAAGVFTIDNAGPGTATGSVNDQDQAFQIGFDASSATTPFVVETAILGPFNGVTPEAGQRMGLFVGLGDQDNFVQIVLAGDNGGEIQVHSEMDGVTAGAGAAALPIPGSTDVEFRLTLDPTSLLLQASYATDSLNYFDVGAPISVPESWFNDSLAAGLIATNPAAGALPVTWDYLRILEVASPPSAFFAAEPGGGILGSSTFGADSFRIENTSGGDAQIESVMIDLRTGFLPDMIFDPFGSAGDTLGKPFTPDSGAILTGQSGFTNLFPRDNGFDGLEILFNDFDPGEAFTFSYDIDPTTIRGTSGPGPGSSGSVSGLEITGTTVTVNFSDGSSQIGRLFPVDGSGVDAEVVLNASIEAAPTIELLGAPASPSIVSTANQTLRVAGAPGSAVRVFQAESGLFLAPMPFDVDPFETNRVLQVSHRSEVIGPGGFVDIAVTLGDSQIEGGVNHFLAVVEGLDGATSTLSNEILVALNDLPPGSVALPDTVGPTASTVVISPNAAEAGPLVLSASIVDEASPVVAAEYFLDTVGLEGAGIALTAVDGLLDSLSEPVVGVISAAVFDALSAGPHSLFVRGQDAAGNWGDVASTSFDKLESPVVDSLQVNPGIAVAGPLTVTATVSDSFDLVTAVEYFLDAVGIEGTGSPLSAVDGVFDSSSEEVAATIDASEFEALSLGVHTIFVRAQDALGAWGAVASTTFEKRDVPETTGVVVSPESTAFGPIAIEANVSDASDPIVAAEYFLDVVGDEGTGTPLSALDGAFDSMSETVSGSLSPSEIETLAPGTHTVYVRGQDALGGWGEAAGVTFVKQAIPVVSTAVVTPPVAEFGPLVVSAVVSDADSDVVAAEYFLNATGSAGTGVPLAAADGAFDSASETVVGAISAAVFESLPRGTNTVFFRGRDTEGNWGEFATASFQKNVLLAGDYDGNGVVDQLDYDVWATTYGSTVDLRADGDGNGAVDIFDYTIWRENEGRVLLPAALTVSGEIDEGEIDEDDGFDTSRITAAILSMKTIDAIEAALIADDDLSTEGADRLKRMLLEPTRERHRDLAAPVAVAIEEIYQEEPEDDRAEADGRLLGELPRVQAFTL